MRPECSAILPIDELAAVRLQTRERAFLVIADQPAVAGDIGREDGGQPPLNAILGHSTSPHAQGLPEVYGRVPEVSIGARVERRMSN